MKTEFARKCRNFVSTSKTKLQRPGLELFDSPKSKPLTCSEQHRVLTNSIFLVCWLLLFVNPVGSRDHPSLSKDPLPPSRDPDWLAGWPLNYREAGQEQAKAHHSWDSWEAGERPQGCQICGVLSPHTGNTQYTSTKSTHFLSQTHLKNCCKNKESGGKRNMSIFPPWSVHTVVEFCSACWFGFSDLVNLWSC